MEWEGREESGNVEDRRGIHPGVAVGGGAGIILVILALVFGVDPGQFIGGRQGNRQQFNADEERQAKFTRVILRDTEKVWGEQFRKMNLTYREPKLVLFTDEVDSACGRADAAVGPFYCPGDEKVYIDLAFYDTLDRDLGAHGEFARAYVIAHEIGHHVQHLLHYGEDIRPRNKIEANRKSVRMELQADYFAGVWAHYAQERFHYLNDRDIQSAMNAASRIGDDVLQRRARGRVTPDSFTHGTARQRQRWFMEGYKTGSVEGANRLFQLAYEDL